MSINSDEAIEGIADDTWVEVVESLHARGHVANPELHEIVCRALARAFQCGYVEARAEGTPQIVGTLSVEAARTFGVINITRFKPTNGDHHPK